VGEPHRSRPGATQSGETFHLSKKTARMNSSDTPAAPREVSHAMTTLVVVLSLGTMSIRLTNSDQRGKHRPCSPR
jgi:hypothetical protein